MGRLDGKVALVTGAARGTGAEIATAFVAEGARVVLADVLDERGADHAGMLGPAARYVHLDVTSVDEWDAAVGGIAATEGGLDVLVNNAAVLLLATIDRTEPAEFERIMRVNCLGAFLGTKACLPMLRANGNGSIVNLGSIDSVQGTALTAAYTASKFAMRGLTKVTAIENGRFGVRANIVCPAAGNPEMHPPIVGAEDWPPLPPTPSGARTGSRRQWCSSRPTSRGCATAPSSCCIGASARASTSTSRTRSTRAPEPAGSRGRVGPRPWSGSVRRSRG